MASWLLSSGFQPKWKKCGKISCSQTYCQKNTFKGFWLNRNSNRIPESGLEPKLRRSAQISCFSFLSYQIFLHKLIFKSTYMHMCRSVSIHTLSVTLGYIALLVHVQSLTEILLLICHMEVLYMCNEWYKALSTYIWNSQGIYKQPW